MKFLFDFFPFILFYIAYVKWGIYAATATAIGASAVQIVVTLLAGRKVQASQWVSMVLIGVFGGLTLFLQNPIFVMWRSSIVNWLLAGVLLGSLVVLRKNPLKALLGAQMQMPDFAWRRLAWSMVGLFTVMGVLNIVIAKNFSEAAWVNYKTFGSPVITFLFFMGVILLLSRHMTLPAQKQAAPAVRDSSRQP